MALDEDPSRSPPNQETIWRSSCILSDVEYHYGEARWEPGVLA